MVHDAIHEQKWRDAEIVRDIRGVIFGYDRMEHGLSRVPWAEQLGGESTLNLLPVA